MEQNLDIVARKYIRLDKVKWSFLTMFSCFVYLRVNMDIRFLLLFTLGLFYSAGAFNSKYISPL